MPGLAAVFSFIDVQRNITVFEEKGVMRNMWLRIFKSCHELGLDGGHPMQVSHQGVDCNRSRISA